MDKKGYLKCHTLKKLIFLEITTYTKKEIYEKELMNHLKFCSIGFQIQFL